MILNVISTVIMSGKFRFLLLAAATIVTYRFIDNPVIADTVFLGVGLLALTYSYKLVNIYSTILIILVMRLVEMGLRDVFGDINPYTHYLTKVIADTGVIALILLKLWIIHLFRRTFTGNLSIEDLEVTLADLLLMVIYGLYFLLSFVMMGEHFMRHLDDVPIILDSVYALVSTVSSDSFIDGLELAAHLNKHADFFYNNYEFFKAPLNMLEHIVILATSYQFMRKKSPFTA